MFGRGRERVPAPSSVGPYGPGFTKPEHIQMFPPRRRQSRAPPRGGTPAPAGPTCLPYTLPITVPLPTVVSAWEFRSFTDPVFVKL